MCSSDLQFLPGTTLVTGLFSMTFAQVRWFGIIAAIAVMIWSLYKNKPLLAYTLPTFVILFFGTPWFQSWYGLWVLPLAALYWPPLALVLVTAFLLFTPELVSPSKMSLYIPAYALYIYAMVALIRKIREN